MSLQSRRNRAAADRQVLRENQIKQKIENLMVRNLRPLFIRMAKDFEKSVSDSLSVPDQNKYRDRLEKIIARGMKTTAEIFTRNIRNDLKKGISLFEIKADERIEGGKEERKQIALEIAAKVALFIAEQKLKQANLVLETNYKQMRESIDRAIEQLAETKSYRFKIEKKAPVDAGSDLISYDQVGKLASKLFKQTSGSRPDLISFQTVGMAESFSKQAEAEVLNKSDVTIDGEPVKGKLQKSWNAILDSKTREAHADADEEYMGSPIDINDPFVVDGENLMYPRDPAGSAGNVINCRCAVLYVTDDDE